MYIVMIHRGPGAKALGHGGSGVLTPPILLLLLVSKGGLAAARRKQARNGKELSLQIVFFIAFKKNNQTNPYVAPQKEFLFLIRLR